MKLLELSRMIDANACHIIPSLQLFHRIQLLLLDQAVTQSPLSDTDPPHLPYA